MTAYLARKINKIRWARQARIARQFAGNVGVDPDVQTYADLSRLVNVVMRGL
jgi:hypothetical protein